jgi:hypothetical protein
VGGGLFLVVFELADHFEDICRFSGKKGVDWRLRFDDGLSCRGEDKNSMDERRCVVLLVVWCKVCKLHM